MIIESTNVDLAQKPSFCQTPVTGSTGLNVLSLFDGMSCGQIALNRIGIEYDNYFASEIDKHAIKVTQTNYPNTIQLGDVTKIKGSDLPKIDLLIGGSPCQGFSFAGKGLNFEDPRSKLFFEFVRLKNETQPKYWLLENVKMKAEHQAIISELLGVQPIKINSGLVSAQNRERLYWANFGIAQPTDKSVLLKDIIENGFIDRSKAYCIDANYWKGGNFTQYYTKARRQLVFKDKAQTILSTIYKENAKSMMQRKKLGLVVSDGDYARKLTPIECERLQTVPDNYTNCVSDTQRYKMLGNGWTVDVIAHIFGGLS
jgi:DNA-cytosine methyltransferase